MPKVEYRSNAKPSVYAPPPLLEEKKREEKERVAAAVLSITARAKRREAAHSKTTSGAHSSGTTPTAASAAATTTTPAAEKMDVDGESDGKAVEDKKDKKEEKDKPKEEPLFEILANPARVVRQQVKYSADFNYSPRFLTSNYKFNDCGLSRICNIVKSGAHGRKLKVYPTKGYRHRRYHRNALRSNGPTGRIG